MADQKIRVQAPLLKDVCKAAFGLGCVPEDHAEIAAEVLAKTDLMGIQTHGVARLIPYLKRLNANLVNPNPEIKILEPSPAKRVVDGDHAQILSHTLHSVLSLITLYSAAINLFIPSIGRRFYSVISSFCYGLRYCSGC